MRPTPKRTRSIDSTSCTLHPTPYTLHPTLYTLHPTTYTLHPTPYQVVQDLLSGLGIWITLKLTCWVRGTNPSILRRKMAWSHPIGETKSTETERGIRIPGSGF